MESYGTILRKAREAKGISIETAAQETSILQQYIEALESEMTGVFHGEAYVIGFLRNYGDYLELDSQRLINLYRNVLLQEAPVPEGLIEKPTSPYVIPAIILGGLFGVAAIVLLTLYFKVYRPQQIEKQNTYAISSKVQQKTYELGDMPLNERLYVGDQILVPVSGGNVVFTVASDINSRLGLETPQGLQYFELSETRELDVDGDNSFDVVVDVWEISSNETSRGAEVYMMLRDSSFVENVDSTSIPMASSSQKRSQTPILDDNRAYPFTLNATFRNPCVFRYEVDRNESVENYYSNGDAITMTANNRVRIWGANGNAVKFQIVAAGRTHDLEIAKAGEVIVQDIKWIKSDDIHYRLVVEELD